MGDKLAEVLVGTLAVIMLAMLAAMVVAFIVAGMLWLAIAMLVAVIAALVTLVPVVTWGWLVLDALKLLRPRLEDARWEQVAGGVASGGGVLVVAAVLAHFTPLGPLAARTVLAPVGVSWALLRWIGREWTDIWPAVLDDGSQASVGGVQLQWLVVSPPLVVTTALLPAAVLASWGTLLLCKARTGTAEEEAGSGAPDGATLQRGIHASASGRK